MSIVFSDRFRYTLIVSFYKERIFLKHSLIRFSAVPEGGPGWVRLVNGAEGGDNTARKHNNEEKT